MSNSMWTKDPDDIADYRWDWANRLAAGEYLADHVILVDQPGLVVGLNTHDATSVTAWLSGGGDGGTPGRYVVTCRVTTNQARTFDSSRVVVVRQR